MRLDHLLSKENRVICFVTVWVLVSTRLVASFLSLFGVWFGREVVASFLGGKLSMRIVVRVGDQ